MKYICKECKDEHPCILDIVESDFEPCLCPYGLSGIEPEWKEFKEGNVMDKFVVCENCANNDCTCSLCNSCVNGSNFEQKTNGVSANDILFHSPQSDPSCQSAVEEHEHYRHGSVVDQEKGKINELVDAHWNYVNSLLLVSADRDRLFTFNDVMAMREFDYKSVAKHFYGHGFEDGINKGKDEY